ncbi:MAG: hypothetical protein IFNCLDLE_02313 [Ignavibacteriaceae bacterium]|nr:hypothetical protein [Ignavibacteriaceae bacterium]
MGGGGENRNDWSDEPYAWFVQKSGNGRIIVLSAADETDWIPQYLVSLGASYASNLKINSVALANSQAVADSISSADGVFIKGGDQYNYIKYWKGTLTEAAIKAVWQRGGAVGGTSAGAMVLSKFIISAKYGTLSPESGISNPFQQTANIESDFLGMMPNTIFDTHFIERARQGRLVAFMAQLFLSGNSEVAGVGIDDRTAICISPDGKGVVMGSGAVAIYKADSLTTYRRDGNKYELENLSVQQLVKNWEYDFNSGTVSVIPSSARAITHPLATAFANSVYLTGGNYQSMAHAGTLSEIATKSSGGNIMIFAATAYLSQAQAIKGVLDGHSATSEIIEYTAASENDQALLQRINTAATFIFTGSDITGLKPLLTPSSNVGNALKTRFGETGVISAFIGETARLASDFFPDNLFSDQYAAYRGKMTVQKGFGLISGFSYGPLTYDNSTYHENRMSALIWAAFKTGINYAVYNHGVGTTSFEPASKLVYYRNFPLFLYDFSEATIADSSKYRASGSSAPRQAAAFDHYRISVSNNYDRVFSLITKKFEDTPTSVKEINSNPENFEIGAYPNPFNTNTILYITTPTETECIITLNSSTGEEISTVFSGIIQPGKTELNIDARNLPSGVYFARAYFVNGTVLTQKLLLLK